MASAVWLAAAAAQAQAPGATPPAAAPAMGDVAPADYAKAAAWLCRPGVDDGTCSTGLDAVAIDGAGTRTPAPFVPAKDAAVDCFYVYPTVSNDPTLYSDLAPGPEERRATRSQAARLGSVCRLFVPLYHQLTMTALRFSMQAAAGAAPKIDFDPAYAGVLAAWRSYLARDNGGRGFVLVGHSQGAILLKRLIAEEIDGKPAQKRLVGAYLAGNVDLTDRSFRAIPACTAAGQTGCVVGWSSYEEGDEHRRFFGGAADAGTKAICVNPAAPGGGRAMLKTFLPKPAIAPAGDPPFVAVDGQLGAECVADAHGNVLRIRIEPTPFAGLLGAALKRSSLAAMGWGLHPLDVNLVEGNMIDDIAAQSAAWKRP